MLFITKMISKSYKIVISGVLLAMAIKMLNKIELKTNKKFIVYFKFSKYFQLSAISFLLPLEVRVKKFFRNSDKYGILEEASDHKKTR